MQVKVIVKQNYKDKSNAEKQIKKRIISQIDRKRRSMS